MQRCQDALLVSLIYFILQLLINKESRLLELMKMMRSCLVHVYHVGLLCSVSDVEHRDGWNWSTCRSPIIPLLSSIQSETERPSGCKRMVALSES